MKKFLFTATMLVCFSALSKAQQGRVGINTTAPDATLDIVANTTDTTRPDALLVPRMTRAQLIGKDGAYNYTSAAVPQQNAALVYVTAIDGTVTTKTTNVTAIGFYYFDGPAGAWKAVGGGGSSTDTSIYLNNGTLASPRTVTQNNQNLTFTTGATARLIVDGNQQNNGAMFVNGNALRVNATQMTSSAWLATDYMVILTGTGAPNLPDATANTGRVLMLNNNSGSNLTFGGTDTKFKPVNLSTVYGGRGYTFVSDGTAWYTISGY